MAHAAVIGEGEAPSPPSLRGLPLLGSLAPFVRDPMAMLLDGYRRHGPIFRVHLPGRRFTVLAGPEANVFAGRAGDLFVSRDFWTGYAREVGVDTFLPSMDGPEHHRLRKIMQRGYSRGSILRRFPEVVSITRDVTRTLREGQVVPAVALMRRAVTEQLGLLLANRRPGDHFDDVVTFVRTALNVTVLHRWPRLLLASPRYRRARRGMLTLGEELLASHAAGLVGPEPDLVDDILAASREGRHPFGHLDLLIAVVGPFIAGLDTSANTCAFMLYALLTNPDALARVVAEADALFAGGLPTPEGLEGSAALKGAVMETMRLYPIAPFLGRTATRPFTFAGHAVAAGEELLVATTLSHRLPELFRDPERFDIDRFSRREHQQPGAYAPFGFGPHTCLGGGMAELQIALTMATLLRDFHFALDPPGQRLRIRMDPTPTAGPRLKVRVALR